MGVDRMRLSPLLICALALLGILHPVYAAPAVCDLDTDICADDSTAAVTIKQTVTIDITSAAAYTGALKYSVEAGYGSALGIYDTTTLAYSLGCTVTSKVSTRRGDVKIELTASVSTEKATEAQTKAKIITKDTLAAAITAVTTARVNAGLISAGDVPTITVKAVSSPSITYPATEETGLRTWALVLIIVVAALIAVCIAVYGIVKCSSTADNTGKSDDIADKTAKPGVEQSGPGIVLQDVAKPADVAVTDADDAPTLSEPQGDVGVGCCETRGKL